MKKNILSATFIILFIGLKAQQARVKKGTTHPQEKWKNYCKRSG